MGFRRGEEAISSSSLLSKNFPWESHTGPYPSQQRTEPKKIIMQVEPLPLPIPKAPHKSTLVLTRARNMFLLLNKNILRHLKPFTANCQKYTSTSQMRGTTHGQENRLKIWRKKENSVSLITCAAMPRSMKPEEILSGVQKRSLSYLLWASYTLKTMLTFMQSDITRIRQFYKAYKNDGSSTNILFASHRMTAINNSWINWHIVCLQ